MYIYLHLQECLIVHEIYFCDLIFKTFAPLIVQIIVIIKLLYHFRLLSFQHLQVLFLKGLFWMATYWLVDARPGVEFENLLLFEGGLFFYHMLLENLPNPGPLSHPSFSLCHTGT